MELLQVQVGSTKENWIGVKIIFRYIIGTLKTGLTSRANSESLDAITDASFRGLDDLTSTGGYALRLYGKLVAWRSHKQSYQVVLGKTFYPVYIWCDNNSAGDCTQKEWHKLKIYQENIKKINKDLEVREREREREQEERSKKVVEEN